MNIPKKEPSYSTSFSAWLFLTSLLALFLMVPSTLAESDETYSGLLSMLEAEMSEAVILDWLQTIEEVPPRPSADEMIALRKAGASDEVLRHYLAMARGEAPEAPQAPPAPVSPVSEPVPSLPAPKTKPAPPAPAPAPVPVSVKLPVAPTTAESRPRDLDLPSGGVPVEFRATYLPYEDDEDEETWDFYIYINSQLLTFVPAGNPLVRNKPLRFRQNLKPGRYMLRVMQERHSKRIGGRWEHEARVAETTFEFDLADGDRAEVVIRFKQPRFALGQHNRPLGFEFIQGDRMDTLDRQGGDPDYWPLLCEEIEANVKPGKKPNRSKRRALESCLRWADLWKDDPEIEIVPRDAIREGMAELNFRPMPRNQLSD